MRALLALGLMLLLPQLAHAADWRYCLAPVHANPYVQANLRLLEDAYRSGKSIQ